MATRAPFAYFGGKQYMVPSLLDLLPPHTVYVEVFGGSGALLCRAQGMVILSGYRSNLYDAALSDWRRVDLETVNWSSNKAREKRVECIWLSPNATAHQPTLPFEQAEEVNHASA